MAILTGSSTVTSTATLSGTAIAGQPEIEVLLDGEVIVDGETDPIDYGLGIQGEKSLRKTFVIKNLGTLELVITSIIIPGGFTVTEFPSRISPSEEGNLIIELNNDAINIFEGTVFLTNNDIDEPLYDWVIKGQVDASEGVDCLTPEGKKVVTSKFFLPNCKKSNPLCNPTEGAIVAAITVCRQNL